MSTSPYTKNKSLQESIEKTERFRQFLKDNPEGVTITQIVEYLDISRPTAAKWVKKSFVRAIPDIWPALYVHKEESDSSVGCDNPEIHYELKEGEFETYHNEMRKRFEDKESIDLVTLPGIVGPAKMKAFLAKYTAYIYELERRSNAQS